MSNDDDFLMLVPEELLTEGSEELRKYTNEKSGNTLMQLPEGLSIGGKDYSGWYLNLIEKVGYVDLANCYLCLKPQQKAMLIKETKKLEPMPVTGIVREVRAVAKEYVPTDEIYEALREALGEEPVGRADSDLDRTTVLPPLQDSEHKPEETKAEAPAVDAKKAQAAPPAAAKEPEQPQAAAEPAVPTADAESSSCADSAESGPAEEAKETGVVSSPLQQPQKPKAAVPAVDCGAEVPAAPKATGQKAATSEQDACQKSGACSFYTLQEGASLLAHSLQEKDVADYECNEHGVLTKAAFAAYLADAYDRMLAEQLATEAKAAADQSGR